MDNSYGLPGRFAPTVANLSRFSSAFKSFWHAMTSNDRHAPHDSPYRTGQHVPISQNRHAPLSSVATNANESQPDLASSSYHDESKRPSVSTTGAPMSPHRPYSPGMRSMSSPKVPQVEEVASPGEIQMQSFADGAPPPPPVSHSWKKIDAWAEKQYTELWDQLGEGCTQNDVNELEHELDVSLPQDVRDSLAIHDGQERGGRPTGIIFGCMLLDCEEIVQEWKNWKVVNEEYLNSQRRNQQPVYPIKGLNNGASSSHNTQPANSKLWRQELQDKQDSQPPKAVQKAYAHPAWISLARDWGGNNIAVDLAPGPTGKWGQIILFGRDYDCKYVVARSWSHFLAIVADDLNSEKTFVDEDSGDLKLREFKTETVEPAYMDILRWRADQKYGRRAPSKRPKPPPGLNTNVGGSNGRVSPYASAGAAAGAGEDRGRSPQRFSRGQSHSPRHGVGSPLARVQEEIAQPQPVRPGGDVIKDFGAIVEGNERRPEKLIDAPTPTSAKPPKNKLIDLPTPVTAGPDRREFPTSSLSRVSTMDDNKENESRDETGKPDVKGLGVDGIEDEMKNVAI